MQRRFRTRINIVTYLIARLVVLHWWGTFCDTRATSPFSCSFQQSRSLSCVEQAESQSWWCKSSARVSVAVVFVEPPLRSLFFFSSRVPVSKLWLSVVDVALRFQPRWVLYHFTLREPDKIRHVWKHLVSLLCLTLQSWACSHNGIIYPGCLWWSSRV